MQQVLLFNKNKTNLASLLTCWYISHNWQCANRKPLTKHTVIYACFLLNFVKMADTFEMSNNYGENNESKKNSGDKKKSGDNKILSVVKSIICVLCVIGLIYQVTILVMQYLEYKTVVNMRFETIKYNRLPSITVCYPRFVSMNKTIEKFPHLRPMFEEYKNALSNVSESDYQSKTLRQYLNNIYEERFEKYIYGQNLTISQLYDLSIDFNFPTNSSNFVSKKSESPIEAVIGGLRRYDDGHTERFRVSDTQPIPTITFPTLTTQNKCFTFFSHLIPTNRQYQMDIRVIFVKVSSIGNACSIFVLYDAGPEYIWFESWSEWPPTPNFSPAHPPLILNACL